MRFCRHWKAASVGQTACPGIRKKVFALIVWKMQQAVQPPYIYEDVLVTVCCQDRKFTAKYKNVLQAGHTAMPVPFAEQEKKQGYGIPQEAGTGRGDSCGERGEKAGLYISAESIYRRHPAFCNGKRRQQGV